MSKEQKPSFSDPLIDEVRAIKKDVSEQHGNDVGQLYAHLQTLKQRYADRIVKRPSKPSQGAAKP